MQRYGAAISIGITLWAFWATSVSDPGFISADSLSDHNALYGQRKDGARFCVTCNWDRPARSKHCSFCNRYGQSTQKKALISLYSPPSLHRFHLLQTQTRHIRSRFCRLTSATCFFTGHGTQSRFVSGSKEASVLVHMRVGSWHTSSAPLACLTILKLTSLYCS